MYPATVRWFAASMCALAIAAQVAQTFWIEPLMWRVEPTALGLVVGLAGLAASVVVPLALYAWPISRRQRPATLGVDAAKARFVVRTEPFWHGLRAIFTAWLGARGAMLSVERVPDGDGLRLSQLSEALPIAITVAVLSLAATALLLFGNRPSLVLEPAGLTVRWRPRQRRIRWEDLLPGGPPPPAKRGLNSLLTLYLAPSDPSAAPSPVNVPVGQLGVSPEFLAATIRHYVEQPERRPAIGTEAELTRLRAALASPALSVG